MQLVATGAIPAARLGRRQLRFPVADLQRWLTEQTHNDPPEI
jgi:excisionase family DNA binding protein